jgi:DNA polymerase/3'-5' exonuclease PolX
MAEQIADSLTEYLKAVDGVTQVTAAGSYRRRKETVGDLDVLVTCSADCPVIDRFVSYGDVLKVISKGSTRSTVVSGQAYKSTCGSFPLRAMGLPSTISQAPSPTTSPSG